MTSFGVWDGSQELGASFGLGPTEAECRVGMVPGGARSVGGLLEIEDFTVAHRLGSINWSEFSARGATESVLRAVEALEISVSRSSDGVWFGLHDQTLLRTSGVDLDPKNMTWHEIQGYLNAAPAGGDPQFGAQPYAPVQDILRAYGQSHVILLDPKYHSGVQWRDEFFAMTEEAVPNAQEHVVIKWSGGGINLADEAAARGYETVGFFYQDEYLADPSGVMANVAHWSWLELEYGAPQATWDVFLATGKPVIGFVAANSTQRQTALTKGAVGVMCSGIREIKGAAVI